MKTRYIKVFRDLRKDYTKNLMLVLAIAVGVFGIGTILGGYGVIKRAMQKNYMGTVPASATIELEQSVSAETVREIASLSGIKYAERHATVRARMKVEDRWHPMLLFVIEDFNNKQTNKVTHISGAKTPAMGGMLVERTALEVMEKNEGEEILIKTPNGEAKRIKISGTVHDPSLAPAWQEQGGYGYITLSTLKWLGESQGFDEIRLLVSDQQLSKSHITNQATKVSDWLKDRNYHVHEIQIPPPGRHPHQSQMSTVMTIFIIFSFLILILGSILVSTSIATLMVRHVRQIGIMKTIGANSFQIKKLYFFMMLTFCIVATLLAIPSSQHAAAALYQNIARLLNLEISNPGIPHWVIIIQVISGLLIPLSAAAVPVVRGSNISVKQALDNYGVAQLKTGVKSWLVRLSGFKVFNEVFLLSLRNAFRQQKRLLMTLGLLAAGGAMFMTALNVSEAWDDNLDRIYTQRLYDLEVRLNSEIAGDHILNQVRKVPGVTHVEGWNQYATSFTSENKFEISQTYPDQGHGSFTMQAIPLPTKLINPTVVRGEWLHENGDNEVVLNQLARTMSDEVKIGDRISLTLNGEATEWKVIGFTEDVGTPATAYVSQSSLSKYIDRSGQTNMFRIAYEDRSKENVLQKSRMIEKLMYEENVPVKMTVPVWLLHSAIAAHMEVMVNALLAMAILMALVGTIGLMSTMSMNIMERTREIGVLRSIGATPGKIQRLVIWEGLIIGAISIFIAFALSVFLSEYMGILIGNLSFRTPLSLVLSPIAIITWIGIVAIGSFLATLFPARRANRISTREALAYE